MGLEINTTIKSLVTLTIYNSQLANAIDSLAFSKASHIWNSIRHANDNSKSFTLHRHLIQSNSDLGYI